MIENNARFGFLPIGRLGFGKLSLKVAVDYSSLRKCATRTCQSVNGNQSSTRAETITHLAISRNQNRNVLARVSAFGEAVSIQMVAPSKFLRRRVVPVV